MQKHYVHLMQIIVIISILFTSFGIPQEVESNTTDSNTAENISITAENEPLIGPPDDLALPPAEYAVVQNADPYLMSLALGNEDTVSRYGPNRNDPDKGIPDHAYSPFDDLDKREVCPPGGCDYVAGKVLIKFEAEQEFSLTRSNEIQFQDQVLASALDTLEITNLTPVFPNAARPAPGEMIETVDGALIEKPDLTRWFQAESTSDKGLGEVIQALQTTAGIAFAEPDFVRKPIGEMTEEINSISKSTSPTTLALPGSGTDPLYDQQWHLGATHVPEAWAYLESQGLPPGGSRDIVVAVIDTGVDYTHPDLAANIWVNPAEFNGTPGVDDDGNGYVDDIHGADTVYPDGDPMDDHGHGTHVAGIIAAQANNGIGGVGVAFNVQVMPIKAAQYSGVLASSDIAEAIYYAVAKGADVINMSFGGYARSTVEEDALAVAFGQAVLVAAAGNDQLPNEKCDQVKPAAPMYPADYNWVLGVMASKSYQDIIGWISHFSNYDCAYFSNYDFYVNNTHEYELMAPGVEIWSTLPRNQYAAWSGTSMSAPVVAGIAALARTKWSDSNIYSSRFIMGQIASNTSQPIGGVANALNALTIPPQPELSYQEYWLFDIPDINSINDNDGIVDAGETVNLAIVIRNHWGKAENVTVALDAWAEGAVSPDPYVSMLIDTVNYGAIGSFNWDDNGLHFDEATGEYSVENPFRFSVSPNTPNNHVIPMKITITAENGFDPTDPNAPYTFISRFYLIVQRGRELPSVISQDMTLTKDDYWLVSDPVLIEPGVTVMVTEGTQIQFWTNGIYDDKGNKNYSYIQVEGTLIVQGSETLPVEMFPSSTSPIGPVYIKIVNSGFSEFSFARISNPLLGDQDLYTDMPINLVDHCYFIQESTKIFDPREGGSVRPTIKSGIVSNSIFHKVGYWYFTLTSYNLMITYAVEIFSNLFDTSVIGLSSPLQDNVFLKNYKQDGWTSSLNQIGYRCLDCDPLTGQANNQDFNNAILNVLWDSSNWMRIYAPSGRDYTTYINNNYWGTESSSLIEGMIYDYIDNWDLSRFSYNPFLTTAPETAYPFVVDVVLSTSSDPDASVVGAEPVTFTVTFNRDMDQTVQPQVSFGPDVPMTDYTVHPIDGGWTDPRTWVWAPSTSPRSPATATS